MRGVPGSGQKIMEGTVASQEYYVIMDSGCTIIHLYNLSLIRGHLPAYFCSPNALHFFIRVAYNHSIPPHGFTPWPPGGSSPRDFYVVCIMKSRVIAFIDGFNLYHALDQRLPYRISGAQAFNMHSPYQQYKWLDLQKLCSCFLTSQEELYWSPEKVARHTRYIAALEHTGVETVYGSFKEKDVYCTQCKKIFKKREEKRTDVNIAIHLLGLAHANVYDRALLVTGDSDLIPAVEWVRKQHPEKRMSVIVPIARPVTKHLRQVANDHSKIKEDHLRRCQLPSVVHLIDGSQILSPYS